MANDRSTFGKTLVTIRQLQRLSQAKLARSAGLNHSYISRLEKEHRVPTREVVERIAKAMGLSETDPQYDMLLDAAGYRTFGISHHFESEFIYDLNVAYRYSSPETRLEIDTTLRLLTEVMEERTRKPAPAPYVMNIPGGY